ncbi:MAG TPA: hypothetical protein VHE14_08920 [Solirubrobacteraceae bacterium]|nr:hypothetical protein [Solirubrobacteraceae bacterium]
MTTVLKILLVGALGLSTSLLVACGDRSRLIPGADASRITSAIDKVQSAVGLHRCNSAIRAADAAQNHISSLPAKVDSRLRRDLSDGVSKLAKSAQQECRQQTTPTQTTTTPTQPTTTTPTTTTPTTTTDTTTTDTTTTDTTTTPRGNGTGGRGTGGTGRGNRTGGFGAGGGAGKGGQ